MRGWSWSMYCSEKSNVNWPFIGRFNACKSMGHDAEPQLASSRSAMNARRNSSERRCLMEDVLSVRRKKRRTRKDQARGGRSTPNDAPSATAMVMVGCVGEERTARTKPSIDVSSIGDVDSGAFI